MPKLVVLTPRAIDDLDEIWTYIAADNPERANRVESEIFASFQSLARYPLLGSRRREITPLPVRFWVVTQFPNHVVVYRPETEPLQVIAVLHARRDIGRILLERERK
jgi:plasmid stabilization system protein ParE